MKGVGYVRLAEEAAPAPAPRALTDFGGEYVAQLTAIGPDTRSDYVGMIERLAGWLEPIIGGAPTVEALDTLHVRQWVNAREAAGAAPKTIRNYHGRVRDDRGEGDPATAGRPDVALGHYDRLLRHRPDDADEIVMLLDVAQDLWLAQQFRPALRWASCAVRAARADASSDRALGLQLALEQRDDYLARLGVPPPAIAEEEHLASADYGAARDDDADHAERAAEATGLKPSLFGSVAEVRERLLRETPYGIVCGFFPQGEWPQAAALWPDVAEDGPSWDDHRGAVALAVDAVNFAFPVYPVSMVPLTVSEVLTIAEEASLPPDRRWTRDLCAVETLRRHPEQIQPWPVRHGKPCWCASGTPVEVCCDRRLSQRARVVADDVRRMLSCRGRASPTTA